MSFIVKGIDLPRKGKIIKLEIEDDGTVWEIGKEWEHYGLSAIRIPTPHGDLIDRNTVRDECYKTMEELMQSTTINISVEALSLLCGFTIINNAPTIIESEE